MLDKLKELCARYEELELKIQDPDFMSRRSEYTAALKEMGRLAGRVDKYREYNSLLKRKAETQELLSMETDKEILELAREEIDEMEGQEEALLEEIKTLLFQDDTHAGRDLIVEIRAGTGGDEASLFAGDLYRMYQKFAESKGQKIEILSSSESEVGGFKELILSITGAEAWDLFRFESGGHRVQRVPVTESQGRIHTSAATVAVLPEVEEVEVDFNESDLKIDTYRSSGPGGQNVNKVSSAIRITHLPTGLVVQCQDEKSQHKNKARALRILKARLHDMELNRAMSERAEERRGQIGTGDRNLRIRTYNFPQNRVTDHRTKKSYSLETVIEGRLEKTIDDLLQWEVQEKIKAL